MDHKNKVKVINKEDRPDYVRILKVLGYSSRKDYVKKNPCHYDKPEYTLNSDIVLEFNDKTDYYLPTIKDKDKPLTSVVTGE